MPGSIAPELRDALRLASDAAVATSAKNAQMGPTQRTLANATATTAPETKGCHLPIAARSCAIAPSTRAISAAKSSAGNVEVSGSPPASEMICFWTIGTSSIRISMPRSPRATITQSAARTISSAAWPILRTVSRRPGGTADDG